MEKEEKKRFIDEIYNTLLDQTALVAHGFVFNEDCNLCEGKRVIEVETPAYQSGGEIVDAVLETKLCPDCSFNGVEDNK